MKKVLGLMKPLKKYAITAIFLTLLSQLMALLLPYLMSMIVNNGIGNSDLEYIKRFGLIMVIAAVAGLVLSIANSYFTARLSSLYGKNLREQVFLKTESLSQCDVDKIGTASLITRSTNDVKQIQDFILIGIRMILTAPIMLVGGTVMAFIMNPRLAIYVFAVVPILGLIVFVLLKLVMPLFKKRQKLTDNLNRLIREKLTGMRVIRAFNKQEEEDEKFENSNTELADLALKIARIFASLIPICIVLAFSGVSALIWVAAKNIDKMDYVTESVKIANTIGDLQAFVVYIIMIVAALSIAAGMFVIVPRANISAKRIAEVLNLETEIVPASNPVTPSKKGNVVFDNVSFRYAGKNKNTLSNLSFEAKSGQTTAIIGGTGSGKSTLINLIPRFYDVSEGKITIGGTAVRDMEGEKLNSLIGYVPQTASLFSGTIADNIRFGCPEATDDEVLDALKIAQAYDFVTALPDGILSPVSQNGTNFSGGQKQRLSIARAIARKSDIYLFDDSFSALDFKTDAAVRKAIREELCDSTVIVIAQRVGTVLGADKIIVLDNGKIAGQGTHAELMDGCEVYREIVRSQLSEDDLERRV